MERLYWNNDWKFAETWEEAMKEAVYPENEMEDVRLPHTCKELPYHYFDEHAYQMLCGYRRHFMAPEAWQGKSVELTFEGVAHDAVVYVNGTEVKAHHCGYTAFFVELAKYLKYGEDNVLAVRVDSRENLNIPPFGYAIDYMTFGGMYREVYVQVRNKTHLADVFVKPQIHPLQVTTEITVQNISDGITLQQEIRKKGEGAYSPLGQKPVKQTNVQTVFPVQEICLWEPENPHLYEIRTSLWKNGEMIDARVDITGFREAGFRKDGFYLNGKKLRLRGLNRHQSYPYVGYAAPSSMQIFDADILKKELGVNAVRTSHYPQSQDFIRRCDEIGLLVFTEFPGWQHIGDEEWKRQAVQNLKEMIVQYRNHPSIILWGVRINESQDDDVFYRETNRVAHELDDTRATGGVRMLKKSHLLEDVYTYNDFLHDGRHPGCNPKRKVTPDMKKPYLISEYNGHMFPTKPFDDEEHRTEHAIRHANVLNAVAQEPDIAGSFGWCMFDYNTHKDFGSGDRICYHGVMDMFRNPKLAAAVYSSQQEDTPVLELSSSMDIGEHPGGNRSGNWMITNADAVRMFKNGKLIKEYHREDSPYRALAHGPIPVNDFIGNAIVENEPMKPKQARLMGQLLNMTAYYGLNNLPAKFYLLALRLMVCYHMKPKDAVALYTRYVGDWGTTSTVYKFEAVRDGKVVKTVIKEPMQQAHLEVKVSAHNLTEGRTYDMAAVRIRALDENGNVLGFFNEPVQFEVKGVLELIGPKTICLQGGMGGTYVKTTGQAGEGILTIENAQTGKICEHFQVAREE